MKIRNKLTHILLTTAVVMMFLSLCVCAKVYTGTEGNYSWSIDLNNGHMSITGQGDMDNYVNFEDAPYSKFLTLIKTLNIEEGITSVGSCSFMYATNLERVVLPDSLLSVGDSAFEYCYNLKQINIPASVTSIGSMSFSSCRALESIVLPSSLENLGSYAFCDCSSLTSVNIPEGITEIAVGAFSGCKALSQITGMTCTVLVSEAAFYGCEALDFEEFPQSITTVSARSFFGCSSLDTTVPENVISPSGAFYNSAILFNVKWNIGKTTEISTVLANQLPQYHGTPKKDCVLDGIYLFKGWDRELSEAVTAQNEYSAVFSLAKPVVSASYVLEDGKVSASATLELSGLASDSAYVLFACYTDDNTMICSKRVCVETKDTSASVVLDLKGRTVSDVRAYIYTDNSYFTPLGEFVQAQKM